MVHDDHLPIWCYMVKCHQTISFLQGLLNSGRQQKHFKEMCAIVSVWNSHTTTA